MQTNKLTYLMTTMTAAAIMLTGCAKEVTDDTGETQQQPTTGQSALNILTRGTGATGEDYVVYPVRVYAFNASGTCAAVQSIADASSTLSLTLNNGKYDIYAIGGAQDDRYLWPTQAEATPTSQLTLADGKTLDDLQAGHATVTLSNETGNLTLALERKVMLIKEVSIKKVPATVTAVSIGVQPLHESLLLNGSYDGDHGDATVALARQADGTTWKSTGSSLYQYPSVGTPSITVRFTTDGQTTSYTYSSDEALPANHKVTIEGTYTGGGVQLNGTLTGQDWGDDKVITFEFDETNLDGGSQDGGGQGGTPAASVPQPGDVYLSKYYVLATNGNTITVLSNKQQTNLVNEQVSDAADATLAAAIQTALASWDNGISTTWRLMTEDEAKLMTNHISDIHTKGLGEGIGNNRDYYIQKADGIYQYIPVSGVTIPGGRANAYLLPVANVTITE